MIAFLFFLCVFSFLSFCIEVPLHFLKTDWYYKRGLLVFRSSRPNNVYNQRVCFRGNDETCVFFGKWYYGVLLRGVIESTESTNHIRLYVPFFYGLVFLVVLFSGVFELYVEPKWSTTSVFVICFGVLLYTYLVAKKFYQHYFSSDAPSHTPPGN